MIIWCHFHLHISRKAAKSMVVLISQSCGELQPVVCLSRLAINFEDHSGTRGCLTSLMKQATANTAWETLSINIIATWLNC